MHLASLSHHPISAVFMHSCAGVVLWPSLPGADGCCSGDRDGVCDPDCMEEADPDCEKTEVCCFPASLLALLAFRAIPGRRPERYPPRHNPSTDPSIS
ncbi:MAG: hypothetical protein AB1295_01980 [Candidatus Micrarchaeota archaeon]